MGGGLSGPGRQEDGGGQRTEQGRGDGGEHDGVGTGDEGVLGGVGEDLAAGVVCLAGRGERGAQGAGGVMPTVVPLSQPCCGASMIA